MVFMVRQPFVFVTQDFFPKVFVCVYVSVYICKTYIFIYKHAYACKHKSHVSAGEVCSVKVSEEL